MKKIVSLALREDIGQKDITTNMLVGPNARAKAYIITREPCVVAGLDVVKQVFRSLDKNIKFKVYRKNGSKVRAGTKLIRISGKTRAILTGERVALNFLSRLCGIATKTRQFVEKVRSTKARIFDTRKTTPIFRILEKNAVRCGGGANHRFSLEDMVLIKDNHHLVIKKGVSMERMIKNMRKKTAQPIAVEVENLTDYERVLSGNPDLILLDNMDIRQIKKAVKLLQKKKGRKKPKLEVSGRVNIHNVATIAKLGVDRISIGSLTHTIASIDMSLDVIPQK